jgi:ATP-dependent RNA helicase DDX54/DBP10
MAPRASSPALSETEFDIFDALAGGDDVQQETGLGADLGILDIGSDDGSGDEAFIAARQAASNRKNSNVGKSVKKGGGFQAMGLNAALLKAIAQKGFKVPTPIQRKAVPLMLDGQDVVGMARTGSGKTAAFVIPMIQKLKAHSAKVGARGIIMSPSRELALQTLRVVKDLGRGTDLRTILLVGGDSLEERMFSCMLKALNASLTLDRIQFYDYEPRHHHRDPWSISSSESRNGSRLVLREVHRFRRSRSPVRDGFCRPTIRDSACSTRFQTDTVI